MATSTAPTAPQEFSGGLPMAEIARDLADRA